MNILGCLDTPTSGRYLLEGLNVAELTDDELAEVRALRIGSCSRASTCCRA